MPASNGHSEACCNTPPVVVSTDDYTPKGSYQDLGGLKTYITSPKDVVAVAVDKGLIVIYDIFGYFPQTLQGADILSTGGSGSGYKVFIPDWFKGNPCPIEWYPPDTKEKQEKLGAWFGQHPPQGVAAALPAYVQAAQAANPSIKSWAVHPAMVDPADAEHISVPHLLIASKDEDVDTIQRFERNLKVPHQVVAFDDQVHGFMAARADLSDPRVREQYARGYETVLDFFSKQWK
ncbi:hypothetical protein DV738_g2791, partial [Chaetothyriales sp. CBS 135597]